MKYYWFSGEGKEYGKYFKLCLKLKYADFYLKSN